MLNSQKKPELRAVTPTHEAIFVEKYDALHQWALGFTDHDPEQAEDLLHDTFIHFTLSRPDLTAIDNLDGFLYVVMRNLHLSQLRKATRTPLRSMSVVEFDTVDVGFWASDPRDRLRLRDELAAVCQFACIRKETSKGGSVLILRFFHGYYPEEIAHVLRSTRAAVTERLRLVRAEAKAFVDDPSRLGIVGGKPPTPVKLRAAEFGSDLRNELKHAIYESRHGEHQTATGLNNIYTSEKCDGPETKSLAHIVSCADCLESVNELLDLPALASRYPLDTLGKDPGPKDRSGGGGGGTGGSRVLDKFVGRRDAHYHHEPQELCISVNGQLQGFQKVVSGKGELTLILDELDSVGFVEVFSEQGLRLLMLNVEPPPVGDGKQIAHVNLSDGRTVGANLDFSGPFPALEVKYHDPALIAAASQAIETSVIPEAIPEREVQVRTVSVSDPASFSERLKSISELMKSLLQPARLTATVAAVLIVAFLIFKFSPFGSPSAADLLTKSIDAENARLADKDRVLHRTLDFEELSSDGQVISRKKIDIYQSGEQSVTARRLYDERGVLTAGDWRASNGIQTIYTRGGPAKLQPVPERRAASVTFEDAWQVSASAQDFKGLIASLDQAQVETRPNSYVISYMAVSGPPAIAGGAVSQGTTEDNDTRAGIIRAAVTLSREDLRVTEQSFTLRQNGETREFRTTETSYEWKPANTVAPAVFEPNIELTGPLTKQAETRPVGSMPSDLPTAEANANTSAALSAAIATPGLEVEVVDALNNAGAFMGEQINVSRTADGKVSVTAMVETADRKRALLAALANFKNNPAVRIQIDTVAEVQARQKPTKAGSTNSSTPTIQSVDVTEGESPVYTELRKRFSDEEARRFADSVLSRSRSARQHALAAQELASRFSESDLASLSPTERARWVAAIRGHAEGFLNETQSLQRELQTVFPEAAAGSASSDSAVGNDRELQARVKELYEASLAIDRALGSSFALTAGRTSAAPVKSSGFWRSFANAVGIAKSLAATK